MLSDTTYNRHVFMPVHAMVDHMMYIYIYIYKQYNTYTIYTIYIYTYDSALCVQCLPTFTQKLTQM